MSNPIPDVFCSQCHFSFRDVKKGIIKMQAEATKSLVSFYVFICEVNPLRILYRYP